MSTLALLPEQPNRILSSNDVAPSATPSIEERVSEAATPWWLHLLTLPVSSYVSQGLAKIFGFQVLRHGTSFPKYVNILKNGANPSCGGSGSSQLNQYDLEASKNYVHVFKDTEGFDFWDRVSIRVFPHGHAMLTGATHAAHIDNDIVRIAAYIFLGIANFFCPTLRFMYRASEITNFEEDDHYPAKGEISPAYKTREALPSHRIGLIGICSHATLDDARQVWNQNYSNVLWGVAEVVAGIALTLLGVGILL